MNTRIHISKATLLKAIVFIAAVTFIFLAKPENIGMKYDYSVGRQWNYDALITPIDIPVYNEPERQKAIEDSLKNNFKPIYYRNEDVATKVISEYRDNLMATPGLNILPTQRNRLVSALSDIYAVGVFDSQGGSAPRAIRMHIGTDSVGEPIPSASFYSFATAHEKLRELNASDSILNSILLKLSPNILPNVLYDSVQNQSELDIYEKYAQAAAEIVHAGTKIVDRGDLINEHTNKVLQSYEAEMKNSGVAETHSINSALGAIILISVMLGLLFVYLHLLRPDYYENFRVVLLLTTTVTAFTIFSFIMAESFDRGIYMVPYTMIPIILIVFLDSRTAFFTYLITLLLCAAMTHFMWDFIIIQFAAGFTALISIRELSKRSQLLRAALLIFLIYSVVYTGIDLMQTAEFDNLEPGMFGAFAINAILISFAYILIFLVEKSFGFISRVTLVELADINHPMLRELSEECPGTFQHSMAVSNIAAAAASHLEANVQLVRAGALYHDIGKISNPAFFTENQHGINPHDSLSPLQSARIVIGHVTEGVKRAEKAKLPSRVRDFILQHHGKGKARFFYTTYCNQHPDEDVDPAPFTYPGPNPQSLEASILMMADAVEAASRSLTDHSPEAIDALVDKIIDTQVKEGLHNDSPISFRDISIIKKSFAQSLRTTFHSRISYPDTVTPANDKKS